MAVLYPLDRANEEPWGGYDHAKKTLAVVAAPKAPDPGCVLWSVGAHIRFEQEESGLYFPDDLGLKPPGEGIWVWEGRAEWFPGSWECPEDGSSELRGTWRRPTETEWAAIQRGECPWNDDAWLHPDWRDKVLADRQRLAGL